MSITSIRGKALIVGLTLAMGPGASARAGYFVNAFAGSPLGYYLFGDVDKSTASVATSATDYSNGISTFSSTGSSSVDLSTGMLHSLASANYGYDPGGLPNSPGDQFGNSSFGDSLTFAGNFTGQTATFHISVDGKWTGDSPSFNASDFQFMLLPAGTIDANASNTLNIFNNPGNVAIVNDKSPLSPSSPNLSLDVNYTLNGLNPTVEFAANLNINPFSSLGQVFSANYSDTAGITLSAPAGVTVYSSSGVFPNTQALPEPGSLTLALAGLAGVGLFLRSRRARA